MNFLILCGTLKKEHEKSNTHAICELVKNRLEPKHTVEIIELSNLNFEVGVDRVQQDGSADDITEVLQKVLMTDCLIFATPIWWGQASSLIQAVMERMTWFDDWYIKHDVNALYGKTFGLIVSGTGDGWQQVYGQCYSFASLLGFTVPPEAAIGLSQQDPEKIATDAEVQQEVERFTRNMRAWTTIMKESKIASLVQQNKLAHTGVIANPAKNV
jgi:multimeric flavodoxin WrbA